MEAKKTDKADLTKKSGLFLSVGLVVTMVLVVMAFEWKQYDEQIADLQGKIWRKNRSNQARENNKKKTLLGNHNRIYI